jgi:hypothetical protein
MLIIQILIPFNYTLAEYFRKVKTGKIKFPNFRDYCPLCGGKDCPTFSGFYYREVVDENGTFYKEFSIARFKCHKKGPINSKHKTFSLLLSQLIPYRKYSIPFIHKVMKEWNLKNKSIKEVFDFLSTLEKKNGIFCVSLSTLYDFKALFIKAQNKIISIGFIPTLRNFINVTDVNQRMRNFLIFLEGKFDRRIRDPSSLAYEFYLYGGGYIKNAPFLFGIPFQFRRKV